MKKLALTLFALALGVSAFSQMRFGGGGGGPMGLLRRHDVQKDLVLTDDQKSKIDSIQEDSRSSMRELFQSQMSEGGGRPDFEKMRPEMEKIQNASQDKIKAVLTPEQYTRLKQIFIQMDGVRSAQNEDVQKDLGVTDAQKAQIKDLQDKQMKAMRAAFEGGERPSREEMQEMRKKMTEVMETELGKILTDAQKAKLKELGGKPFTKDPDEEEGGMGGGGR